MPSYEDLYYKQEKTKELATEDFNNLVDKRLNKKPFIHHGDPYNDISRQENYITTYTLEDLTNIAEQNAFETIMAFLQDVRQKAAYITQNEGTGEGIHITIRVAKECDKESNEHDSLLYREVSIDIATNKKTTGCDMNTNIPSDNLYESGLTTEEPTIGHMKLSTVEGGQLDIHQTVGDVRKKNNPSLDDIAALGILLDPSWKESQIARARGAAVQALVERATSMSRA